MNFFEGAKKVTLEEVLAFREEKNRRQNALLKQFSFPLLSLGLNMPGEYKHFFLAGCSFREEINAVKRTLETEKIPVIHEESFEDAGGFTCFILVNALPEKCKELSSYIEDSHPLGRLFDIDVLKPDGTKISRRDSGKGGRKCLICSGDAFVCGRSRTHDASELANAAVKIMVRFRRDQLADLAAGTALRALLSEAAITPKPGLVDRANNGAHRDMNFFSFIDSTAAIIPYFRFCALAGFDSAADPPALFDSLRPAGKTAEREMLAATGGANTHRGLIFSIGLASAAFGFFFRQKEKITAEELLEFIASMTRRISGDFNAENDLSHGEAIHKRYGIGGIREEAKQGFPAVRDYALPVLRRALSTGRSLNEAGLEVFFNLLTVVTDTNIIHRSGTEALEKIQNDTKTFLAAKPEPPVMAEYAAQLDTEFIEKNISPGGCADLLALSFFLYWVTNTAPSLPSSFL
ncbi:MAG: citrate lyase holo-[acyl-carrier protein] synthase [Treponema sp.]|nr:citrate lyase holo-[acyl-carrier protein] synthase [Treponema sp.]